MSGIALSVIDVTIVIFYLFLCLFVGIRYSGNIRSIKDYAIGETYMPTIILIMTICATLMDSEVFLGMSGQVYTMGIVYFIIIMGGVLNSLFVSEFIGSRVLPYNKGGNILSVSEIIGVMYGKEARVISALSGIALSIGLMVVQSKAMGFILHYFFGVSEAVGVIVGTLVIVFYSTIGGIKSVTFTDVLQFITLAITIPLICNVALVNVEGCVELYRVLPPEMLNLSFTPLEMSRNISLFFVYALPLLSPPLTQRILMMPDAAQVKEAFRLSALFTFFLFFLILNIGLAAYKLYPGIDQNYIFLHLTQEILPTGLKGIAISGMLAAIMSTSDSFLNSASVLCAHDFVKPLWRINERQEIIIAKVSTVVFGLSSIWFALGEGTLLEAMMKAYDTWGLVVAPQLLLGLFGAKKTKEAFMVGAIAGLLCGFLWDLFGLENLTGMHMLLPGFLANALGFLITNAIVSIGKKEALSRS